MDLEAYVPPLPTSVVLLNKKHIYCCLKCIVYDKLLKPRQPFRITLQIKTTNKTHFTVYNILYSQFSHQMALSTHFIEPGGCCCVQQFVFRFLVGLRTFCLLALIISISSVFPFINIYIYIYIYYILCIGWITNCLMFKKFRLLSTVYLCTLSIVLCRFSFTN